MWSGANEHGLDKQPPKSECMMVPARVQEISGLQIKSIAQNHHHSNLRGNRKRNNINQPKHSLITSQISQLQMVHMIIES